MTTGGGKSIVSIEEKWYEKYIGFPYVHLGDDPKSGIDCFNLIRYVYKNELDIDIPYDTTDFCDILDEQWYSKTHESWIDEAATIKYGWERVTKPEIFNVITMNIGSTNVTNHCALYVDKNRILQTKYFKD